MRNLFDDILQERLANEEASAAALEQENAEKEKKEQARLKAIPIRNKWMGDYDSYVRSILEQFMGATGVHYPIEMSTNIEHRESYGGIHRYEIEIIVPKKWLGIFDISEKRKVTIELECAGEWKWGMAGEQFNYLYLWISPTIHLFSLEVHYDFWESGGPDHLGFTKDNKAQSLSELLRRIQ